MNNIKYPNWIIRVTLLMLWLWAWIEIMSMKLIRKFYKPQQFVIINGYITVPSQKRIYNLQNSKDLKNLNILYAFKGINSIWTDCIEFYTQNIDTEWYFTIEYMYMNMKYYMVITAEDLKNANPSTPLLIKHMFDTMSMAVKYALDVCVKANGTVNVLNTDITDSINKYAGPNGSFYYTLQKTMETSMSNDEWIVKQVTNAIKAIDHVMSFESVIIIPYDGEEFEIECYKQ